MRKFCLIIIMMLSIVLGTNAQSYTYQAKSFAIGRVTNYGTTWGNWQSSTIRLRLDYTNGKFYVYSESSQVYRVVETGVVINDGTGQQVDFKVIDQDGDRGTCRLRIENSGSSQFYVFFADIAWVYGDLVRLN